MEKTASTKNTTYTLVAIALMTAVICVLAPLSLPIGPVPISMATADANQPCQTFDPGIY